MGDCCSKDARDAASQLNGNGGAGYPAAAQGALLPSLDRQARPSGLSSPPKHPNGDPPGNHRSANPLTTNPSLTPVEQVDLIKSRLKFTRDRIHNLRSKYQSELLEIGKLVQRERLNGLPDKAKAKYLLKQDRLYRTSLENLLSRESIVARALNDISQQHLDAKVIGVMEEANTYMRDVQNELEGKNWREVVRNAAQNSYKPVQFEQSEQDPEVERLYNELERQAADDKLYSNRPQHTAKTVAANYAGNTVFASEPRHLLLN